MRCCCWCLIRNCHRLWRRRNLSTPRTTTPFWNPPPPLPMTPMRPLSSPPICLAKKPLLPIPPRSFSLSSTKVLHYWSIDYSSVFSILALFRCRIQYLNSSICVYYFVSSIVSCILVSFSVTWCSSPMFILRQLHSALLSFSVVLVFGKWNLNSRELVFISFFELYS